MSLQSKYVSYLQQQLFGPFGGENEWLPRNDPPHKRYITGVLYPRVIDSDGKVLPEIEEELGAVVSDENEPDDSPLAAMLQRQPASAGLTFAVEKDSVLEVRLRAGVYVKSSVPCEGERDTKKKPQGYLRKPVSMVVALAAGEHKRDATYGLFGERAELRVRWRTGSGTVDVVTVSIVNKAETKSGDRATPEDCLYQVQMDVSCIEGAFAEPPLPKVDLNEEDRILQFRYRNSCPWASGHSASACWEHMPNGQPPREISLDFIPSTDVHPFSSNMRKNAQFDKSVLNVKNLSETSDPRQLNQLLTSFVADYLLWVDGLRGLVVAKIYKSAFKKVLSNLDEQGERLKRGIAILCDEKVPDRINSFRIANAAMLDQMEKTALREGRPFVRENAQWRPFQLAFQLLALPGVIEREGGDSRDLVDLIWFPTGGGKTEAYLLLAAFTIIYRRLHYGDKGGGTAIFSRYTLRLLTSQQFERTSALVCALERLRRYKEIPGDERISIGLWIGGGKDSSPNTLKKALDLYEEMLENERPINQFMLMSCPWCGTSIIPPRREEDKSRYGVDCGSNHFHFFCPNKNCEFNDRLPVQVVDQCLYADPPTILLATIDKFARLPWEHRAKSFFGNDGVHRSPDLVIQDELHLISGPLGTIAAIYEAAIDIIIQSGGDSPKYIAATATIRGADDQARRLYGREVRLFPASGTDADDSYFMQTDRTTEFARRYVGIMGQGHTPVTSVVHVMAAMVDAGQYVTNADDYWTLVAYHNSRRELGKTLTLARDDIPARIQLICSEDRQPDRRKCDVVRELSGNLPSYKIPEVLSSLKKSRGSDESVDVLVCTNMISVGVDVGRLNAMFINGQPKTSSEYIQASSRVGRSRETAGVVVVGFSPTKPRDRSHFENFLQFHHALYRWVEPTSVTPHSPPALDRALHASIIAVLRCGSVETAEDEDASQFRDDSNQKNLYEKLRRRLHLAIDKVEHEAFDREFDSIITWWRKAAAEFNVLHYKAESQIHGLMRFHGEKKKPPSRATLNSMRNVDGEIDTQIIGEEQT